ncbi:MAG: XRE family transcriptional regulator [Bacteroidales bacterium]|nr:XRE family transcriptional regulator [Bacteroidales bacterium]
MNTKIHIGTLIKKKLEEEGRSFTWLARKLYRHRTAVNKMFQNPDMNTGQLVRISLILKYNFFRHYANDIDSELNA